MPGWNSKSGKARSARFFEPDRTLSRAAARIWKRHSKVWILLALVGLCPGSFAAGGDLVGTIPRNDQIPDMPFRLYQGYLVIVEGRIGNLDHQNLLLDTGTSP